MDFLFDTNALQNDKFPVNISISTVKFNMQAGSQDSVDLLVAFRNCGNESDIFTTTYVKNLLDYKMGQTRWISYGLLFAYVFYLFMITISTEKVYVRNFFFAHALESTLMFLSSW